MDFVKKIYAAFLREGDAVNFKHPGSEDAAPYMRIIESVEYIFMENKYLVQFEDDKDGDVMLSPTDTLDVVFNWTEAYSKLSNEWIRLYPMDYSTFIDEVRDYPWSDNGCIMQQVKYELDLSGVKSELLEHVCCSGRFCPSCVTILKEELCYLRQIQRF